VVEYQSPDILVASYSLEESPEFDIRSYLRLFNGRMTISGYDRIRLSAYVELR